MDERLIKKAPIFKHGESVVHVDYADRPGETKVSKWADWVCPVCGGVVGEQYVPRRHNQSKSNYCSRCGQAIDWDAVEPEKYKQHERERKELQRLRDMYTEREK